MQESPLLGFWQGKETEASGVSGCAVVLLLPVCAMIFCGIATVLVHGGGMWVGYSFPYQEQGKVCHAATAFSSVVSNTVSPLPELIKAILFTKLEICPKRYPKALFLHLGPFPAAVREMCG